MKIKIKIEHLCAIVKQASKSRIISIILKDIITIAFTLHSSNLKYVSESSLKLSHIFANILAPKISINGQKMKKRL